MNFREPLWLIVGKTISLKQKGSWHVGRCPFHNDENPSFAVGDHVYRCFSCGVSGSFKDWKAFSTGNSTPSRTFKPGKYQLKPTKLEYPDDWVAHPYAVRYFTSRNITPESVKKFKLGYTGWRFSIPNYNDGELVGVKLRRNPNNNEDRGPKYTSLPGSKPGLFNRDILYSTKEVVCVEGELDAIVLDQLGIPAVSSTGGCNTFPSEWIRWFKGLTTVYLWFDSDDPGRKAEVSLYKKFLQLGTPLGIKPLLLHPKIGGTKDVNEWWQHVQRRDT